MKPLVHTGLERFIDDPPDRLSRARLGLLCNPASVDRSFRHARERIADRFPGRLKALFSPQHGFFAEKQDNMIESDHAVDPILDIPIFSLYGETRIPTPEMFDAIDVLLVDLQDVGTRVYTFIYTLSYCMETAARLGRQVVVLDRPNPVDGLTVEGNLLAKEWESFVGRYPIPMRHGLTIGELARLFNGPFGIDCDLSVIPMTGWRREMTFSQTGLPWVAPSPNLPTPTSASVYPGGVLWEGTNISEGRGSTQPFERFGAPFLDPEQILAEMGGPQQPGAILRRDAFEPAFGKWRGRLCRGFQIHLTDPARFRPYTLTLTLLRAILKLHRDPFHWRSPPYEYEYRRLPFDLITGDPAVRRHLEASGDIETLVTSWQADIQTFESIRQSVFLYH